jgi:hypothetical protein
MLMCSIMKIPKSKLIKKIEEFNVTDKNRKI